MKLKFVINEDYLVIHVLSNMSQDRFSSSKYKKEIVSFQNLAWKKSKNCYNFLVSRFSPDDLSNKNIQSIAKELPSFLRTLKKSKQYKKVLSQTKEYLIFCKSQWDKNYQFTIKIMKELTGLKFNKTFAIYITPPSLRNGIYLGNNKIAWGHSEDWLNYSTIYLWHEVLHSYLSRSELNHALIQFITDEELRTRLNGRGYPPFVGHENLFPLMKRILPYWKKYLKSKSKNIMKFQRKLVKLKITQ